MVKKNKKEKMQLGVLREFFLLRGSLWTGRAGCWQAGQPLEQGFWRGGRPGGSWIGTGYRLSRQETEVHHPWLSGRRSDAPALRVLDWAARAEQDERAEPSVHADGGRCV